MSSSKQPPVPPTMHAWTFSNRGPPRKVLKLDINHPVPLPLTGPEILIHVTHAALNPADLTLMNLIPSFLRARPSIPGLDFAGIVSLTGPAASSRYTPGTRVFGSLIPAKTIRSGNGTLAEYIVVSEETASICIAPESMDLQNAAGLGSAGQTAVRMCQKAKIKGGERVMVNGASGGVGTTAVQIVKAMGACVEVGICSGKNAEMVSGLGVDKVVDYQANHPVHEYLSKRYSDRPFDVILDTVGVQTLYEHCPSYLKKEGIYVNVGVFEGLLRTIWCWFKNACWPTILGGVPRTYNMMSTSFDQETAEMLERFAAEGKLSTFMGDVLEMADVLKGYDLILSKRARGKIIVKMQSVPESEAT